jgi:cyclase
VLKRRILIALLFNEGVLFRTKKFQPDYRYTTSFVGSDLVDEIIMVDITRSGPSEESHKTMARIAEQSFVPVTMGGHIKSLDDVKRFFDMGCDKVVVGRECVVRGHLLLPAIAEKWGSQAVVAACDHQAGVVDVGSGGPVKLMDAPGYCHWLEANGAGEIFLQDKDRDGSLSGYDIPTLKRVLAAVKIPVVVGTSCGNAQHMKEAFTCNWPDGAGGCATANIFHFTSTAMRGFKSSLAEYVRPL